MVGILSFIFGMSNIFRLIKTVSGFIDYQPERFTVVARYKRLVVGVALLSPPNETYITYLAVRAGWEGAHIAR